MVRVNGWKKYFAGALAVSTVATMLPSPAWARPYKGVVFSGADPVPGVAVTATRNGKTFSALTNARGEYQFDDLADGDWTVRAELRFFTAQTQSITISPSTQTTRWDLKVVPLSEAMAQVTVVPFSAVASIRSCYSRYGATCSQPWFPARPASEWQREQRRDLAILALAGLWKYA